MNSTYLKRQIFRPALNGLEVLEIAALFKKHAPMSALTAKFAVQAFKLSEGVSDPAYVKKPDIAERLEITSSVDTPADRATRMLNAYNIWITGAENCSLSQLADACMYRYENDLMNSEEEKEFESKQGVNFS